LMVPMVFSLVALVLAVSEYFLFLFRHERVLQPGEGNLQLFHVGSVGQSRVVHFFL
jgi:hypothetical protein